MHKMNFLTPDWPAPNHIRAYTTLRHGWGGKENDNLNGGDKDDLKAMQGSHLNVLLNLPEDPIWITQTHSNIAIEATLEHKYHIADASYTSHPQRVCVVLTADCLPLLICNRDGTHVAAIHAGWRGLANGVIEAALSALPQPFNELIVWLGPAIGPQKFEVGKDVFDAFTLTHPTTKRAFLPSNQDKWLANLYELAKIRLNEQGVTQIFGGQYCTYTQADLFFSYRRDHGQTGRMASLIWIDKN